jgi:hypothetical protein
VRLRTGHKDDGRDDEPQSAESKGMNLLHRGFRDDGRASPHTIMSAITLATAMARLDMTTSSDGSPAVTFV